MRRAIIFAGIIALSPVVSSEAVADSSITSSLTVFASLLGPSQTGQPNQSCGSPGAEMTPGNSASSPGSAFNPNGKAPSVYAGQQPQNSINSAAVSQYDVACFEVTSAPAPF